jgi:PPOX class probable FMN-dependent enzyme
MADQALSSDSDTSNSASGDRIDSREQLRELLGQPMAGIGEKNVDHLDDFARAFLEKCPFLVLSTASADGQQDASPKGDAPGFVRIEDARTIVIPDRPGNKLAYGLENILENPKVGVLFLIPGTPETLRINGHAEIYRDPELLEGLAARGRPAVLAIRVHIEECFFHCAKAFIRSKLWKPEEWGERHKVSFGEMFAARAKGDAAMVKVVDEAVESDYRENL